MNQFKVGDIVTFDYTKSIQYLCEIISIYHGVADMTCLWNGAIFEDIIIKNMPIHHIKLAEGPDFLKIWPIGLPNFSANISAGNLVLSNSGLKLYHAWLNWANPGLSYNKTVPQQTFGPDNTVCQHEPMQYIGFREMLTICKKCEITL